MSNYNNFHFSLVAFFFSFKYKLHKISCGLNTNYRREEKRNGRVINSLIFIFINCEKWNGIVVVVFDLPFIYLNIFSFLLPCNKKRRRPTIVNLLWWLSFKVFLGGILYLSANPLTILNAFYTIQPIIFQSIFQLV